MLNSYKKSFVVFQSTFQFVAYLSIVLFFLVLPVFLSWTGQDSVESRYKAIADEYYSYVHQQIFEETKDIDILFLGFCFIRMGVRVTTIQKDLSKELGRETTVLAFGTYRAAQDLIFLMLSDLLKRRKVKMLVMQMPLAGASQAEPHLYAPQWIRFKDVLDLGRGMSPLQYIRLYSAAVLAAPRNFLGSVRQDFVPSHAEADKGLGIVDYKYCNHHTPFEPLDIARKEVDPEDLIYSSKTAHSFHFTNEGYPPYQEQLLKQLIDLVKQHQIPLVQLHLPNLLEKEATKVEERYHWSEKFNYPIQVVGIPTGLLFKDLDPRAAKCLFWDDAHFNPNGTDYFTRTVGPTFISLYRRLVRHD